ncbi:MAG: exosortase/archaeosortase family protein [Candidatus Bathyarchaeia archaeon]
MKNIKNLLIKITPIVSFIIPIAILYHLEPASFEKAWRGRIFLIFFIWTALLEAILDWERLHVKFIARKSLKRAFLFFLFALAPTIFVIFFNYYRYSDEIIKIATENNVAEWIAKELPASLEFLFLTVLFCLTVLIAYGIENLPVFSGSIFFLGIMGLLFTIDDLHPGGKFAPLQMLVPVTAFFAASFLGVAGYKATLSEFNDPVFGLVSILEVNGEQFKIGWLCAGVESLVIYTVVIFLFLKKSDIAAKRKLLYFILGAAVTYLINIMRIFTLVMIALSGNMKYFHDFHNFYGSFYSITWITIYPVIIMGIENLLKIR